VTGELSAKMSKAERNRGGTSVPPIEGESPRSLMEKTRVCGTRDWEFESPRGHQKFKIANFKLQIDF